MLHCSSKWINGKPWVIFVLLHYLVVQGVGFEPTNPYGIGSWSIRIPFNGTLRLWPCSATPAQAATFNRNILGKVQRLTVARFSGIIPFLPFFFVQCCASAICLFLWTNFRTQGVHAYATVAFILTENIIPCIQFRRENRLRGTIEASNEFADPASGRLSSGAG